jgi:hypothetical protein
MVRRRRPRLNGAEKAELWRRWRQGESLQAIGRALGWVTKCMHYVVAGAGGVPPGHRAAAPGCVEWAPQHPSLRLY